MNVAAFHSVVTNCVKLPTGNLPQENSSHPKFVFSTYSLNSASYLHLLRMS